MMEQRISLVTLGVANVATARAFYERLGWTASSASMDEVVFFDMGGWMFGLYGQSNLSKDSGLTENKPVPGGITLAYNTRSREEVDHFMDEVKEAGATILQALWKCPGVVMSGISPTPMVIPGKFPGCHTSPSLKTEDWKSPNDPCIRGIETGFRKRFADGD